MGCVRRDGVDAGARRVASPAALPSGPLAIVFDECYGRMLDAKTRRDALDRAITELAAEPPYADVVERLVCLRGVSTLDGVRVDRRARRLDRFRPPRSARSSASPRASTQAGAAPPRRDHQDRQHTRAPAPGRGRLAPTPATAPQRHARTQTHGKPPPYEPRPSSSARRLHGRWHALEGRGKPRSIVVVAVARELAGHCWALATMSSRPATARRGERTGATTRGATRENTASSPHRPRSTPENGTAPHLAHRSCGTNPRI